MGAGFSLGGGAAAAAAEDDDDVDLFGSDDEEDADAAAEKQRITDERLAAHDAMLKSVKSIEQDGLTWGASKLIPIGYGIKKLQVMCTVEDDKVSIEELQEKIEAFEDYVQSCDVNAMNKI